MSATHYNPVPAMTATNQEWFEDEEFWITESAVLFNKNMLRFTFFETDRLIKLAGMKNGMSVLDLCCGIGRHSIDLAKKGFTVTGVDITGNYIEIAKQKAEQENVQVEFIRQDARTYYNPQHFDVIINMFNSFGYFINIEDDIKLVKNCYDSLKPGGKLVIELLGKEVFAAGFQETSFFEHDGHQVYTEQKILNDWEWVECKWRIVKDGVDKEISYAHRLYSAVELKQLLHQCGFRKTNAYGDLSGSVYNNKSKGLVVIGEK